MRTLTTCLVFALAGTLGTTVTFANPPTTQVCLGDLDKLLTCPAGAKRMGTECRVPEPHQGAAPGEHWSRSKRQGPSLFVHGGKVSLAASYKVHKKQGRAYRFDRKGALESISDFSADQYNGLHVTCLPDGRVSSIAYFKQGQRVGLSRSWRTKDGTLSTAFDNGNGTGASKAVAPTAALEQRPDALCQPVRCDLNAAPDLSGVPK